MKIKVMYRAQCLAAALGYGPEYDAENIDEPTLIISISSTDDKLPLIMNFADTFLQYVDKVSQIIVHCDAGYSRSPAVAAALAKALGESDEEFFGHDYCINNHVYTTLLKQLSERKILK